MKPVKKHLQNLISATRTCVNGKTNSLALLCPYTHLTSHSGHSLLHISWLMTVLSRVFVHHEAKSIIRWGVQATLDMPLENSPLLVKEHWGVSSR